MSLVLFYIFAGAQPPDEDPASYRLVFEDDFDILCNNPDDDSVLTNVNVNKWMSIAPWMKAVPEYIVPRFCNNIDTIKEEISYRRWHFENAEIDTTGPGIIKIIANKEDFIAPYYNERWQKRYRLFHYSN